MIKRHAPLALAMTALVICAGAGPAHAATYPPARYFHLPAAVIGAPSLPSSEGGGACVGAGGRPCAPQDVSGVGDCITSPDASRLCHNYRYDVKANVPVHSNDGPYSFYEVDIYPTVAQARTANLTARDRLATDDAGHVVPYKPIAQPLTANEWLRGNPVEGVPGDCYSFGGVRYQNIVMYARVVAHGTVTGRGSAPCTQTYQWVTRALRNVYGRAAAYRG